jgi:hypothetical protein
MKGLDLRDCEEITSAGYGVLAQAKNLQQLRIRSSKGRKELRRERRGERERENREREKRNRRGKGEEGRIEKGTRVRKRESR